MSVQDLKEALSTPNNVDILAAILAVGWNNRSVATPMSDETFAMTMKDLDTNHMEAALDVLKVHNCYHDFSGAQTMAMARFFAENYGIRVDGGYPAYDDVQIVRVEVDQELTDAQLAVKLAQANVKTTRAATLEVIAEAGASVDRHARRSREEDDALEALMAAQADLKHAQNKRQRRE